jgi:hypothetical protein
MVIQLVLHRLVYCQYKTTEFYKKYNNIARVITSGSIYFLTSDEVILNQIHDEHGVAAVTGHVGEVVVVRGVQQHAVPRAVARGRRQALALSRLASRPVQLAPAHAHVVSTHFLCASRPRVSLINQLMFTDYQL